MLKIFPYSMFTEGGKLLRDALETVFIKREDSKYRPRLGDKIINWGCARMPQFAPATIINHPDKVSLCTNKLKFFQSVPAEIVPPWTTDKEVARAWNKTIVCRTLLSANEGRGIVIVEPEEPEIPDAPLYTMYKKKKGEYRVHWVNGETRVAKKLRKRDFDGERDHKVRNTANGYVFTLRDFVVPPPVLDVARRAFEAIGIDFGAADVIYNEHENKAYVLEINTAPGIEGSTVDWYAEQFRKYING